MKSTCISFQFETSVLQGRTKNFVWYILLAFVKIAQSETSRERLPDKMASYKCTTDTDK